MNADVLFKEFRTEKLVLRNRIVMPPMTRRSSPNGVPGEEVARYYRRHAEGGVGLIITEGTTIGRAASANDSAIPNIYAQASRNGWRRVVEAVHEAGAKIASQLWHQGSPRNVGPGYHSNATSEVGSSVRTGRGMTKNGIEDAIAAFSSAASNAKKLGFDAVEIHGAHGYLIDQFLWSKTNQRTDGYGGDIRARTRFAVEVVKGIRRAVGPDFPIMFRFSQWKMQDHSARLAHTPKELEEVLDPLTDSGVDIFHASTRWFWQAEFDDSNLNLAGWARKITGKPAISVGSVSLGGADFMEQVLGKADGSPREKIDQLLLRMQANEFDLIAIGRALIANPDWPKKVHEGRFDEVHAFDRVLLKFLT